MVVTMDDRSIFRPNPDLKLLGQVRNNEDQSIIYCIKSKEGLFLR